MVPVSSELTLEHVVIRVDDLDAAMKDFAALGFHVVYGGVHSSGVTHNALIHFQNGTFIELVAYRKPMLLTVLKKLGLLDLLLKNTDNHVKYRFAAAVGFPEGFMDAALLSKDIDQDTRLANDRGLKTTKPMPFQRKKPNGDSVRWNIMCPFADALPFVRDPYVPEQPTSQDDMRHGNGALGISHVVYGVGDLEAATADYEGLLGIEISISTRDGKRRAVFELGDVTVTLLPVGEFPHLAAALSDKRETPVQVTLGTNNEASAGLLAMDKSHRAEIVLEHA
ncbi:MAG: VOC family protein [Alphaproteobacteria bacterium]|nr:VOC family protein [Alphaproteobacteria bacterium]